jgi:hypothetical protein
VARLNTSAAIDERVRRRAAASRSAARTASESLNPSLRMTSSAAAALSSKRTCRDRLIGVKCSTYRATHETIDRGYPGANSRCAAETPEEVVRATVEEPENSVPDAVPEAEPPAPAPAPTDAVRAAEATRALAAFAPAFPPAAAPSGPNSRLACAEAAIGACAAADRTALEAEPPSGAPTPCATAVNALSPRPAPPAR